MNPLILELVRQGLRWLAVTMTQLPWLITLTENEEFVLWTAGIVTYVLTDTWWLKLFIAKWKAWRARRNA